MAISPLQQLVLMVSMIAPEGTHLFAGCAVVDGKPSPDDKPPKLQTDADGNLIPDAYYPPGAKP